MRTFIAAFLIVICSPVLCMSEESNRDCEMPEALKNAAFNPQEKDLQLPNKSEFNPKNQITLEAWFKTDAIGKRQHIIYKLYTVLREPYYQYNLELRDTGELYFALAINGVRCLIDRAFPDRVYPKKWYHVAATYDGKIMRLYLNGQEWGKPYPVKGTLNNYPTQLVIGAVNQADNRFKGALAEVRIWNVARTREEIVAKMNETIQANEKGLVWSSTIWASFELEFNRQEYYQIINKVSGFGLLPAWSGERPTERGMHHWPMGQRAQNQDGFLWRIIHRYDDYYWIINKVSGFGLLPAWSGERPTERGMHHWPMGQRAQNQDGFLWRIIHRYDDYYWIINKVSGFGLLPAWSGERPKERGMHHWPMGQRAQNQDGFLWRIVHVHDDYYQIINKVSGYGLLPQYSGEKPQFRGMHHWPMGQSGQNQDGFLWEIKRASFAVPKYTNITYGESYHLKNVYGGGSYLDTCGHAKCTTGTRYGVVTHSNPDRVGKGSGKWIPISATGKSNGEAMRIGDVIHLKNVYGGGSYLDTCGHAKCTTGTRYGVVTHSNPDRVGKGSGKWVFEKPE